MKELVFATNNPHKLEEIRQILGESYRIISLKELGFAGEIPETGKTLKDNALQKARFINERYGVNCFADDTGLEVDALNGAPGIYSARYAGEGCSYEDNIKKLLRELNGNPLRTARFKTIIALIVNNDVHYFEGKVEGEITKEPEGSEGFGYDPVFLPKGYSLTFSEMGPEEKNKISHRAKAVKKLVRWLLKNY